MSSKKYNVCVVGVGSVGIEMLRILKERNFPIRRLRVFARTPRKIKIGRSSYNVETISPEGFKGIDIALFAGTEGEKGAALRFASEAVKMGAVVIDNGADFRMDPKVPLVIPEVNPQDVVKHKGIIANPNCSTIQMVAAVYPIYKEFGIRKIIVCSYQAVSGAGRGGVIQLGNELDGKPVLDKVFSFSIAKNVIPHIGGFGKADYTSEEWKMVHETHKIMRDKKINISATCVRVPVVTGHSEAIYIETKKKASAAKAKSVLSKAKGIKVVDDVKKAGYPMPVNAEGKDNVFVGRIRKDPFNEKGLWLWVVSDNLRKGAALNAVQIAEEVIKVTPPKAD